MKQVLAILLILLLTACSDNGTSAKSNADNAKELRLVVIAPLDNESSLHWKNTAAWFEKNLEKAFASIGVEAPFSLDIEWFNENNENMNALGSRLANRDNISAIIGPMQSKNLDTIAEHISNAPGQKKIMISPMTTASEIIRKYAGQQWFFSLTETDIAQCEVLLARVLASDNKSVSLLSSESDNVKTFIDWFAFQAAELGLTVDTIITYRDSSQLETAANKMFSEEHGFVICVPDNYTEVQGMLKAHKKNKSSSKLFFSNTAHNENVTKLSDAEGIEGISIGADPSTGFNIAYKAKFDTYPIDGEAQFYDALLLAALAQMKFVVDDLGSLNAGLRNILELDTAAEKISAWEPLSMARILKKIQDSETFNISGASNDLDFEFDKGSVILQTTYIHWKIESGKFTPIEYFTTNGSKRTAAATLSYNWMFAHVVDQIDLNGIVKKIEYPKKSGNYAILVATSSDWTNYRHQADVLSMYKILKTNGFDDKHIILIIEDDLAEHPSNPEPGTLINYEGESIYDDVQVDYITSKLKPQDLHNILLGKKSDLLPQVIDADSTENIFVFWSGHGGFRHLTWPNGIFTYDNMLSLVTEMAAEKKYRKMLWVIESCYSGSMCQAFSDSEAKGALCITAANGNEPSKAIAFNSKWHAFTSNSFSMNFMNVIKKIDANDPDNDKSISDIYYYTVQNTLGSHASIYNTDNYGDLHANGIREFVLAK